MAPSPLKHLVEGDAGERRHLAIAVLQPLQPEVVSLAPIGDRRDRRPNRISRPS
jgi:hypothetical protein